MFHSTGVRFSFLQTDERQKGTASGGHEGGSCLLIKVSIALTKLSVVLTHCSIATMHDIPR